MSWIDSRQFKIADRNGRHYVFRRNNAGNTEINIPKQITTKAEAARWLRAHPEKVAKPDKYRAKRPVVRLPPHVAAAFNPFAVDPYPRNMRQSPGYFFRYSSPRYGGAPSPEKAGTPKTNMSPANFKKSLKNMVSIGSGRQGRAYIARQGKSQFVLKIAPYDKSAKSRGERQPGDIEYDINYACMKVAPEGVVKLYSHIHALDFVPEANLGSIKNLDKPHFELSKQNIIVMELCEGGALEKWFDKHRPSDDMMRRIIKQILTTLRTLMIKYPYFRHNDLHLENIFVSKKRGFLIADFGWARLKAQGTNPAVNTANGTATASYYGVGPKTNSRYDMHLFLNSIREKCLKDPGLVPKTLKFLNAVIPEGYRGKTDTHVNDFRVKYDDPCPGLPRLTKVLSHPFLNKKLVTSPELARAKAALRKTGRNGSAAPRPVRVTSAELLAAKARLKRVRGPSPPKKRTYTNAELVALTRNQLFKLSPTTRARAVKLRAALRPTTNAKKANNATARVKVKPGQGANKKKLRNIPRNVLENPKFVKLWLGIHKNLTPWGGETVHNTESRARNMARNIIRNRLNKGLPAFSPSPVKPKNASPKAKSVSPKKARVNSSTKLRRAMVNAQKSPGSGRLKIRAPHTKRLVYVNGGSVSLQYLKNFAKFHGVNIKGLRSKTDISEKLFG
jgi:serine/threonine protein kinase